MAGLVRSLLSCFAPAATTPNCVFCGIENTPGNAVLYQDDTFVAFKDRKPAAKHHFLVIPRAHVGSVKSLTEKDALFLKDMEQVGTALLDKYNIPQEERRMGFHIPPFNSVDHLHLHVHALPYNSTFTAKKYPIVNGWGSYHKGFIWFVEIGQAVRILESGRRIGVLPC